MTFKRPRLASAMIARVVMLALLLWGAGAWADDAPGSPSVEMSAETGQPHGTGEKIAAALRRAGIPDGWTVFLISALPIVELRGAIPVGFIFKMNPALVFVLAVAGNMLPVPFILLFLGPMSRFAMRFKLGKRFFEWLFARTRKKTAEIEKYETLGLTVFVAIPLPATGAWTGAMAAFLLGMEFHHAMWSILLGVLIAGVIMAVLSWMGWIGAAVAGVALLVLTVAAMARMLRKEEKR